MVQVPKHVPYVKQGFPMSGFGIFQVDDANKIPSAATISQQFVQMSML
jgi:hypothetical protein